MVLLAYRHGFRVSELVGLRWDAVDFNAGRLHVNRAKNGSPSTHPLSGRELRALRRLRREQEPQSPFVFVSERHAPFTTGGFRKLVARLGVAAGFEFPVHPHMLRHACGFQLANRGTDTRTLQAYLGHKNIQHTVATPSLPRSGSKGCGRTEDGGKSDTCVRCATGSCPAWRGCPRRSWGWRRVVVTLAPCPRGNEGRHRTPPQPRQHTNPPCSHARRVGPNRAGLRENSCLIAGPIVPLLPLSRSMVTVRQPPRYRRS